MTRRRMLALGAVGLGTLAVGDGGQVPATLTRPLAKGRATIRPVAAPPHKPRRRIPPPNAPVPARKIAAHTVHDLFPTAPPNAIALTIDDGPQWEYTPKMLDLLAEFDVKATFSL